MGIGRKVLKRRAAAPKFNFKYETTAQPKGVVGKYYPADDVVKKKGAVPVRNAPKVRNSLAPGTVVILVAGRFKGKRAVVLKSLKSGLLLINGPYSTNGVPLRRVNQRYVIATSTKVGLNGVDVSKIDDDFFKREAKNTKKGVLAEEKTSTTISDARKKAQTAVDTALTKNITDPMMASWLKAKFALKNSDKPHAMKF
eukprot:TRINITY_DN47935_c0_g1_i1.p1 TRINITY_DN47935_c0_g1~~TRINITY_DN47935_c0_g1_i1.p1  ORF type:complete len:198 (-),score=1.94 TRINITY_DN47935_c0_g1_i1:140-733(-)